MKKNIYVVIAIFLGVFLSFIIHAVIEIIYIKYSLNNGAALANHPMFGKHCVLPHWLNYGLLVVGIVGGFFLGLYWWKVVYIQKRHWRLKKNKIK